MKRLATLVLVVALTLGGCASIGTFTPPSQGVCDKIAYYDSYLESAQRAIIVIQFIPGISGYAMQASLALSAVGATLDDAHSICTAAQTGQTSLVQTKVALDAVFNAVQNFNVAYGKAKAGMLQQ